jgi:SAM-dependent methyltransferase
MRALDVLDIGAGNCWLSYRLSLRGHRPVAVDLITNSMDGLGAATHYLTKLRTLFPRFQAEADALPFASSQYDCIIYNASFHYSEDYLTTIAEAVRCLRDGGTIVVADSPWYSRNESGVQMVAERQQAFTGRFGFPSNGLSSQEFLTDERLERMAQLYGFTWQVFTPKYGVRWAMRPWIAKLRNRREPSQFRVYMAEVHK